MKKILVIGCFGDKTGRLDGQIVKTRDIYSMLQDKIGKRCNLDYFNTLSVRENRFDLFVLAYKLLFCDIVILIPADHNLESFFPHLYRLSKIIKFEIIQLCVGGWQVDFFIGRGKWLAHPMQMKMSSDCRAFLPEINKVNEELKNLCHFSNCEVFPNFRRNIPPIKRVNRTKTLRLVWLARINRNKGFEVIFNLAKTIRERNLDINITFYGRVEPNDCTLFKALLLENEATVSYKGQLPSEQITDTLCEYDIMLFPTRYYTEGFPGTILDAYISGLPVIATNWMHAHEFIEDGVSGFVIPFENPEKELFDKVCRLYQDRELLFFMKEQARRKTQMYTEEKAWSVLSRYLV